MSPLTLGRGLKLQIIGVGEQLYKSPLTLGRGLKSDRSSSRGMVSAVAPYTGAWIEIAMAIAS